LIAATEYATWFAEGYLSHYHYTKFNPIVYMSFAGNPFIFPDCANLRYSHSSRRSPGTAAGPARLLLIIEHFWQAELSRAAKPLSAGIYPNGGTSFKLQETVGKKLFLIKRCWADIIFIRGGTTLTLRACNISYVHWLGSLRTVILTNVFYCPLGIIVVTLTYYILRFLDTETKIMFKQITLA
jgi:hypothetical protein